MGTITQSLFSIEKLTIRSIFFKWYIFILFYTNKILPITEIANNDSLSSDSTRKIRIKHVYLNFKVTLSKYVQ